MDSVHINYGVHVVYGRVGIQHTLYTTLKMQTSCVCVERYIRKHCISHLCVPRYTALVER